MAAQSPYDILREDHRQAVALTQGMGVERTRALLERAAAELESRLRTMPDTTTFTAVRLRTLLAQVQHVIRNVQTGMRATLEGVTDVASAKAAENVVRQLKAADRTHRGVGQAPLQLEEAKLFDAAAVGARASLLRRIAHDPDDPARPGVLQRYGVETIKHFEEVLQKSMVAQTPWERVKRELVEKSPFLQGMPASWSERIVRTESMGCLNRATWEANREANDQLGDVVKILSATFDERTNSDSYAVHGQIRHPEEAFESWYGLYQHPPNRPNDREIVVTHRKSWPLPPYLAWKSAEEIAARWKAEGRKGAPPKRPKMTTIPLEEFGKAPEPAAIKP